jgi:hypothetical protein
MEVFMKVRTLMETVSKFGLLISLLLIHPFPGHSENVSPQPAPVASGVYKGEVLEVENHTLVVKQTDGDTVRVPMPGKSGKESSDFRVGEAVEVSVSSEGITTSVRRQLRP